MTATPTPRLYDYQGEPRTVPEIAKLAGMKPITLYMRLRRGMPLHRAVTVPVGHRRSRR